MGVPHPDLGWDTPRHDGLGTPIRKDGVPPIWKYGGTPVSQMGVYIPAKCEQTHTCINSTFLHHSDVGGKYFGWKNAVIFDTIRKSDAVLLDYLTDLKLHRTK